MFPVWGKKMRTVSAIGPSQSAKGSGVFWVPLGEPRSIWALEFPLWAIQGLHWETHTYTVIALLGLHGMAPFGTQSIPPIIASDVKKFCDVNALLTQGALWK